MILRAQRFGFMGAAEFGQRLRCGLSGLFNQSEIFATQLFVRHQSKFGENKRLLLVPGSEQDPSQT